MGFEPTKEKLWEAINLLMADKEVPDDLEEDILDYVQEVPQIFWKNGYYVLDVDHTYNLQILPAHMLSD